MVGERVSCSESGVKKQKKRDENEPIYLQESEFSDLLHRNKKIDEPSTFLL